MKRLDLLAVAMVPIVLGSATGAEAQNSLPLLGVDVDLGHYGIEGPHAVKRGRVSIAYAPEGPRLTTYWLRDTPRPPRRGDPPEDPDSTLPDENGALDSQTALWVWNTAELVRVGSARADFLDFIEAQGITRLFLYLPAADGERPAAGYIPFSSEEMGPFLAEIRERGALVYALDGDKDYVLPENHAGVYRTVDRLVAHNRSVPPEQRFHGVRYDIEPYLSPGFQGPQRGQLLDWYVELVAGVAMRARAGGLKAAVDVPFWLDQPNEETGELLFATYAGEQRGIIDHLMDHVDDIAIMDYRTRSDGPNGALNHAQGEMATGARKGVGVFVGVETIELLDEDLHTFFGPAVEGLPSSPGVRWVVLEARDEQRGRIWLVEGREALDELTEHVADARSVRHWPAGRPTRIAADMQSFYNLGPAAMERVTDELVGGLSHRSAFLGLAYHDYEGLRALLSQR